MADEQLVHFARRRGFVTAADVDRALARQRELADRGVERSLWVILQDVGALSVERAREIQATTSSDRVQALDVGGFVLQGRVGSGGMGDVFHGVDRDGNEAAVKLLPPRSAQDREYLARFQRETQALARVRHPHITTYLGSGSIDGRPYLIMELVRGDSLKQRLASGRALSARDGLILARHMAMALAAAWEQARVVHRDVKPANILLAPARTGIDEPFCGKLCDFGLAKGEEAIDDLTQTGLAIGTPHYMSPEQAAGDRSADPRHDIYGLGATLWHALLGHTLHSGRSSATIMLKQVTAELDPGPLAAIGLPADLVAMVSRMLAKHRDHRYPDWASTLTAIDTTLADLERSTPRAKASVPVALVRRASPIEPPVVDAALESALPMGQRLERPVRRSLAGLILAVAAVIVIAAGLGLLLFGSQGARSVGVDPDSIAGHLASLDASDDEAGSSAELRLVLAPGTYRAPIQLPRRPGVLRIEARGAILSVPGGVVGLQPAAGAGLVRIDGLEVRLEADSQLTQLPSNSRLRLDGCNVSGPGQLGRLEPGASLYLHALRATGLSSGLQAAVGADLTIERSLLRSQGAVIRADGAAIELKSVHLHSLDESALSLRGGTAVITGLRSISAAGSAVGIWFGPGFGEIVGLEAEGGRIGLMVPSGGDLRSLSGARVVATDEAVVVEAEASVIANWSWTALTTVSERPGRGLPAQQPDQLPAPAAASSALARVPAKQDP